MVRTQLACGTGRRCAFGDRNHGNVGEGREHRLVLGQIEPAVQRGQERGRLPGEQRERIVVEMEVQEVEFLVVTFLPDALQHHHMQRVGIANRSVEPQRLRPCRVEFRGGLGIAAGEQRDVVSQCDKFLGQPVHHPFGAAIQFGGNSLRQRSNLRDAHLTVSCHDREWKSPTSWPASACRRGNVSASAKFPERALVRTTSSTRGLADAITSDQTFAVRAAAE